MPERLLRSALTTWQFSTWNRRFKGIFLGSIHTYTGLCIPSLENRHVQSISLHRSFRGTLQRVMLSRGLEKEHQCNWLLHSRATQSSIISEFTRIEKAATITRCKCKYTRTHVRPFIYTFDYNLSYTNAWCKSNDATKCARNPLVGLPAGGIKIQLKRRTILQYELLIYIDINKTRRKRSTRFALKYQWFSRSKCRVVSELWTWQLDRLK